MAVAGCSAQHHAATHAVQLQRVGGATHPLAGLPVTTCAFPQTPALLTPLIAGADSVVDATLTAGPDVTVDGQTFATWTAKVNSVIVGPSTLPALTIAENGGAADYSFTGHVVAFLAKASGGVAGDYYLVNGLQGVLPVEADGTLDLTCPGPATAAKVANPATVTKSNYTEAKFSALVKSTAASQ
jgi:hypothetical protein